MGREAEIELAIQTASSNPVASSAAGRGGSRSSVRLGDLLMRLATRTTAARGRRWSAP